MNTQRFSTAWLQALAQEISRLAALGYSDDTIAQVVKFGPVANVRSQVIFLQKVEQE